MSRRVVGAVLPCPLEEDFNVRAHAREVLRRLDLHIVTDPTSDPAGLRESEILITGFESQTVSPLEFAQAMPRLRWVHSMYAGVESLISESLLEREIVVTSSAGAYAVAMAEYAFAAMVLLARRIPELLVAGSQHQWHEPHPLGIELAGKRVGIVGYGGVGRALARLCAPAGMSVWGLRRRVTPEHDDSVERVLPTIELDELLGESDFVIVAASSNPTTRRLLERMRLEAMKPGAFLVNVARGALVDERALVDALHSGRLAGAVLDVTAVEPLPPESELWDVPNLWITPHMSGGTLESRTRTLEILLSNISAYLDGHLDEMLNRVDLAFELSMAEGATC